MKKLYNGFGKLYDTKGNSYEGYWKDDINALRLWGYLKR
jgi:hypothetical protein